MDPSLSISISFSCPDILEAVLTFKESSPINNVPKKYFNFIFFTSLILRHLMTKKVPSGLS